MQIKTILIAISIFLLTPLATTAQSPGEISYEDHSVMPEGRLGERINEVIDVINANSPKAIEQFITGSCAERFRDIAPMQTHIDVFLSQFMETGGLDFHSIRSYVPERPDEVVVVLKDRHFQSWRAIVLQYDEEADLITSLRFSTARTPSNVIEPGMPSLEAVVQEVESFMKRLCDKDVFSGTVLIANRDEVLFETACGEASKRFHVANTIDTKFNLGSMNKMFTSTAVMQLVEQGEVALDDPISKYVDESWLPAAITGKVTVHHLLTHTAGLGSYFNQTYWDSSRELFRKVEDYRPLVHGEELRFEPGTDYRYSNTGMLLLGVVIERASGLDYFDYIRQHIYKPAGMHNSDSYEMDQPVENLAIGYIASRSNATGWENNLYKHVIKGGPAGGGFSTVRDLHRYALAMLNGTLISEASRDKMWTENRDGYGFGFSVEDRAAGKIVGHGGGFPGLNGNLDIFVDQGIIVAVLSNHNRGAQPVARRIYDLVQRIGGS